MATPQRESLKLTQEPELVNWPETHYVFIEKVGPFQETAGHAWQALHQLVPGILEHNTVTGYISLYKIAPKIYRAGVSLSAEPRNLPAGLVYEKFKGGKYSKFVLMGLMPTCRRLAVEFLRLSPKRKFRCAMTSALKITPTIREPHQRIS